MATIAVVPAIESSSPKLIAPRWHTVLLIALFLGLALSGALFQRQAHAQPGRLLEHSHVALFTSRSSPWNGDSSSMCGGVACGAAEPSCASSLAEDGGAPRMSQLMRASH